VVYKDHLARDYDNFGVDKSCDGLWTFEKYGIRIERTGLHEDPQETLR